ncbi:ketosteroid isomerase-like protein [Mucilaginibacter sp. SG538B]|uniref:nuclear transport factor 2 family protein n=1 Tax=Mucilaginibacter sp. SG538B TaxID=2587021 RepID=UPI001825B511|nr:nuclear transport factor 2 family protein [Mucilaginibacter sp. SG538B]NVM66878.1 ketosteroid isomerase-like protein [Mucilaginibacter sp. SG538B]
MLELIIKLFNQNYAFNRMDLDNKNVLLKANALVAEGNNEGFLSLCTEDIKWDFVGDKTLIGKEAVRAYMKEVYVKPPRFDVENLIAEGDFVTAIGKISTKDEDGKIIDYAYCDVWSFRDNKMAELKAFVIEIKPNK